jgi:hypothetical protein
VHYQLMLALPAAIQFPSAAGQSMVVSRHELSKLTCMSQFSCVAALLLLLAASYCLFPLSTLPHETPSTVPLDHNVHTTRRCCQIWMSYANHGERALTNKIEILPKGTGMALFMARS